MKTWKISTMPSRSAKDISPSAEQAVVFKQLIDILRPYSKPCDIRVHTAIQYQLWTRHVYRTKSVRAKVQRGVLFTGLAICRTHVGLYFYPLHINSDLANSIPEGLKELLNGGSSFHIQNLSEGLIDQIKDLLHIGWMDYLSRGWVQRYE